MKARNDKVTLADIERALIVYAGLYDLYGECMKPLLDRMEREYMAAKSKVNQMNRIRKLIAGPVEIQ